MCGILDGLSLKNRGRLWLSPMMTTIGGPIGRARGGGMADLAAGVVAQAIGDLVVVMVVVIGLEVVVVIGLVVVVVMVVVVTAKKDPGTRRAVDPSSASATADTPYRWPHSPPVAR